MKEEELEKRKKKTNKSIPRMSGAGHREWLVGGRGEGVPRACAVLSKPVARSC